MIHPCPKPKKEPKSCRTTASSRRRTPRRRSTRRSAVSRKLREPRLPKSIVSTAVQPDEIFIVLGGKGYIFSKPVQAARPKRSVTLARKRRAKKQRGQEAARYRCVGDVLQRDGYACRACGSMGRPELEVHEEPSRAQGGDPTLPHDCLTICGGPGSCHEARHRGTGANRLHICVLDAERGTAGPIEFTRYGRTWTTEPPR